MKTPFLALLLASPLPLSATVVYSGEQNLAVAWDDLEGVYVNVATGATAVVWPEDFDNAPWINLTLGGYGIFNSELVKPWGLSGGESYDPEQETDYYLNLEEGSLILPALFWRARGDRNSTWRSRQNPASSLSGKTASSGSRSKRNSPAIPITAGSASLRTIAASAPWWIGHSRTRRDKASR